jgi:VWFA-related protein
MPKLIITLALTAFTLLAQSAAPPALMRLDPVVLDAGGQPVTDLTAADFKIVDDSKPQNVLFFRKPVTGPAPAPGPLEYTNRPGGAMPHSVVIIFDILNMNRADALDTWHDLAKSLPQLEAGDSVYFYMLTLEGDLDPLHAIGPKSPDDHTWPQQMDKALDKAMKAHLHGRPVQMGMEEQVKKTFHNLEVIATQLQGLPGRRDILWITNGIMNVYNTKQPCNGDWVECALYVPHLAVTLANANVAVNPLVYSRDLSPDVNRDLEQLGLLTGGRSYFREDIRAVLKQVATAAASTYEIAYEPPADNWNSKFHVIHLTCERKGVKVQARTRYYAVPDARPAADRQRAALIPAYQSPFDAADIGLRVKMSPADKGVHLDIHINAADVLMREQGGKFTGSMMFMFSDMGPSGPIGDPSASVFNLDLTKEQHDGVMKDGIPISQDHATAAAVVRVRLIVLDQNTNAVGVLTFPVK